VSPPAGGTWARVERWLLLALGLLVAAILLTGGGTPHVAGLRVALDRPQNPFLLLLLLLAVRWGRTGARWTVSRPRLLVGGAVAGYVAVFGLVTALRHRAFRTHAFDLGIFDQVVWHLARGEAPHSSILGHHFFGEHFSPILYAVAVVYRLAPTPLTLLVLQSLALGLGGLAVLALARDRLRHEGLAAAFAVLYLLYPALHGINLFDFHPVAFATPLLLGALVALRRDRPGVAVALLALVLACQEDQALPVAALGGYLALVERRRALGAGLLVAGLLTFWAELALVIPAFRQAPYAFYERYATLGGTPEAVARTLLGQPALVLAHLVTLEKLWYLARLLLPLGLLPLLGPAQLLPAVPTLFLNLASDLPAQHSTDYQYTAPIIPFVFLAGIHGAARALARVATGWPALDPGAAAARAVPFLLLGSLALGTSALHAVRLPQLRPSARHAVVPALLARIPAEASVAAADPFVPHLSQRADIRFPPGPGPAYVLVDELRREGELTRRLLAAGYVALAARHGFVLLRRE
jgi:uncharacterized membrane protein